MLSTRIKQLAIRIRQNPDDSFSKFALALELKKAGDARRALALFESIQTADPDYAGVYYHFGKTCELLQDRDRALEIYRQGLDRIPASETRTRSELQEALDQLKEEL